MKTMLDIIKSKKSDIARDIDLLKRRHKLFEGIDSNDIYVIHSYEYLFSLAILLKQDLVLDEILASYYAQEEEQELANIHVGKEVWSYV